jgi:hypothetical protein
MELKMPGNTKKKLIIITLFILVIRGNTSIADEVERQMVQLPEMMQQHMMSNMRDHLAAINEILVNMANGNLDQASEIAEYRLGMSSLELHGAGHMSGRQEQACIGQQATSH